MKTLTLNKKNNRIPVVFGLLVIPVVAMINQWFHFYFSIPEPDSVVVKWICTLIILSITWYIQLHLLHYIRNNANVKLYRVDTLLQYCAIVLLVPFALACFAVAFSTIFQWKYLQFGNSIFSVFTDLLLTSLFCNLWYDIFLLSKQKQNVEEKAARLEVQKIRAELNMLKAQLNPHFIYNSLNTLAYLTSFNAENARSFIELFSTIYKYVLQNITVDWVELSREIAFAQDYVDLQKIKSGNTIGMTVAIREDYLKKYAIPPLSLQLLVENAIKHNSYSSADPLVISIEILGHSIVVRNKLRPRVQKISSSKLGLYNLNERYRLLADKEIRVTATNDYFTVYLPILKNKPI